VSHFAMRLATRLIFACPLKFPIPPPANVLSTGLWDRLTVVYTSTFSPHSEPVHPLFMRSTFDITVVRVHEPIAGLLVCVSVAGLEIAVSCTRSEM
jgi:hypothetical protein